MKKEILLGITAFSMLIASCGGGEAEGTGTDTTATDSVVAPALTDYAIDTTASIITWGAHPKVGDTTYSHTGVVKALGGNVTAQDSAGTWTLTAGSFDVNMSSIKENNGDGKLDGHLKTPDFFDVAQFATAGFVFEGIDEMGNINGTLTVIGQTMHLTLSGDVVITAETVTITVPMFTINFGAVNMPYFVAEKAMKPEKQHDPNIEITATIVANKVAL